MDTGSAATTRPAASAVATTARRGAMLAGVLGVLAVEYALRDGLVSRESPEAVIAAVAGIEWVLLAVLLLWWVPRVERATVGSVGVGPWRMRYLWRGAGWFLAATVVSAGFGALLGTLGGESLADLQPRLSGYGWPVLPVLGLTGPVVEEILYRGYLIERVAALTGRVWVAAAVSWVAFTGVHLGFFGPGATLNAAVLSAALVWLYVRERSIWPVLVLHALNSGFAYLLVPLLD